MTYTPQDRVINSEPAEEILRLLKEETELYSKQLKEKTGRPKNTINTNIKILRDLNLIERTKRTQAQYYTITGKGKTFLSRKQELEKKREELKEWLK